MGDDGGGGEAGEQAPERGARGGAEKLLGECDDGPGVVVEAQAERGVAGDCGAEEDRDGAIGGEGA